MRKFKGNSRRWFWVGLTSLLLLSPAWAEDGDYSEFQEPPNPEIAMLEKALGVCQASLNSDIEKRNKLDSQFPKKSASGSTDIEGDIAKLNLIAEMLELDKKIKATACRCRKLEEELRQTEHEAVCSKALWNEEAINLERRLAPDRVKDHPEKVATALAAFYNDMATPTCKGKLIISDETKRLLDEAGLTESQTIQVTLSGEELVMVRDYTSGRIWTMKKSLVTAFNEQATDLTRPGYEIIDRMGNSPGGFSNSCQQLLATYSMKLERAGTYSMDTIAQMVKKKCQADFENSFVQSMEVGIFVARFIPFVDAWFTVLDPEKEWSTSETARRTIISAALDISLVGKLPKAANKIIFLAAMIQLGTDVNDQFRKGCLSPADFMTGLIVSQVFGFGVNKAIGKLGINPIDLTNKAAVKAAIKSSQDRMNQFIKARKARNCKLAKQLLAAQMLENFDGTFKNPKFETQMLDHLPDGSLWLSVKVNVLDKDKNPTTIIVRLHQSAVDCGVMKIDNVHLPNLIEANTIPNSELRKALREYGQEWGACEIEIAKSDRTSNSLGRPGVFKENTGFYRVDVSTE